MNQETMTRLVAAAMQAREKSYAPYSGFSVGAALLTDDGAVFLGANIENASFSPTLCAERVAFGAAIAAGYRKFSRIAVVGGKKNADPAGAFPPCGVCRQVMAEFCNDDFEILLSDAGECRPCTGRSRC